MISSSTKSGRFQRGILWLVYKLLWLMLPRTVLTAARFAVAKMEPTPHAGGEKRGLVYVKLLQQFPRFPRRLLSLAVEIAVYREF